MSGREVSAEKQVRHPAANGGSMSSRDIKPELIGKAARAAREAIRGREDWIASEDDWIGYIVPAALESVAGDIRAEALREAAEAFWGNQMIREGDVKEWLRGRADRIEARDE